MRFARISSDPPLVQDDPGQSELIRGFSKLIERCDGGLRQAQARDRDVLGKVRRTGGPGDQLRLIVVRKQPGQRDLRWRDACVRGNRRDQSVVRRLPAFPSGTFWKPTVRPVSAGDSTTKVPSPSVLSTATPSRPHQKGASAEGQCCRSPDSQLMPSSRHLPVRLVRPRPRTERVTESCAKHTLDD